MILFSVTCFSVCSCAYICWVCAPCVIDIHLLVRFESVPEVMCCVTAYIALLVHDGVILMPILDKKAI